MSVFQVRRLNCLNIIVRLNIERDTIIYAFPKKEPFGMGLSAIRSPGLKTISPINFGTLLIKPAFVHRSLEMLYREQILSNMHDKLHMSPRKGILNRTGAFKIIMAPFLNLLMF